MEEEVGVCIKCGKKLFCLDGFFNGIVQEDKGLICFSCYNDKKERKFNSL